VTPLGTRADSAPVGGGDKIRAQHIFDLNTHSTLTKGVFRGSLAGSQLLFNIDNVFDESPAFFNGASGVRHSRGTRMAAL